MKRLLGSGLLRTLAAAPDATVLRALRGNLGARRLAVVFHHVGEARDKVTMPAAEIDALLRFLLEARGELTVHFDDGYADSADYLRTRVGTLPGVEWMFFVCPRQTEEGLSGLATARDVRALGHRGVTLGNHTNRHERLALLRWAEAREELQASTRDFERLFGPQRHFAFPYGVPREDFREEHVRALRALGEYQIWSTEPRPFHARERRPGAVLPRFCIDGRRSWKESAVHIAVHALRERLGGEARG